MIKAVRSVKEGFRQFERLAAEGEAAATGPATGPGVLVETWKQERDPEKDHVLIQGTLANVERRPDGTVAPWLTRIAGACATTPSNSSGKRCVNIMPWRPPPEQPMK